jgi:acetyl-CoA carboxylase biotin carboxyl carrier protein
VAAPAPAAQAGCAGGETPDYKLADRRHVLLGLQPDAPPFVKAGDHVTEDTVVCVIEAMKMEMPVVAPITGTVKEICVAPGQEVEAEAVIAVIE